MFPVALGLFQFASGQMCVEYDGDVCGNTITGLVWTQDMDMYASAIANSTYDESEASRLITLSPSCYYSFMNYTCGVYFPPCDESSGTPVPVPICVGVCERSYEACYSWFRIGNEEDTLDTCEEGEHRIPQTTLKYPNDNLGI